MVGRALLADGWQSLGRGDWAAARATFEIGAETPEALVGLSLARWWTRDPRGAIEARTRAYAALRRAGDDDAAVLAAVWVARELRSLFGSHAAADGWLARARSLARPGAAATGWVLLATGEATAGPAAAAPLTQALSVALTHGDRDLEMLARADLGLHRIAYGEVSDGTRLVDEAMAAASGGEAEDLANVCQVYCALRSAGDLLGDDARFAQWSDAVADLGAGPGFGPLENQWSGPVAGALSAFCGACCGGMHLVTGRLDDAEDELVRALRDLQSNGLASRCVHPAATLAELRVLQGRLEEADLLLRPYLDLPGAVRALAQLDLARGSAEAAVARLRAVVDEPSYPPVPALPLLALLVDAEVAAARPDDARATVARMQAVADLTGTARHRGEALLGAGKVALADAEEAAALLRRAAAVLASAGAALPSCRARLALARSLVETDPPVAVSEARAALAAFERLGATVDADRAAALLRDLGVRGRTGPRSVDRLTRRETEVLRLVAQGLTNAEIAGRLFISTKTAGNHVSSILVKLGLRSRTEAAAFAAVHLPAEREQR